MAETVAARRADAVVVAVGGAPVVPPVPGVRGENVVLAVDLAHGRELAGQAVVVIGGQQAGCDIALYLERAHELVEQVPTVVVNPDQIEARTNRALTGVGEGTSE